MRNIEKFFPIVLVFVFVIFSLSMASAKEITVDDNHDADFTSIQAAINAAHAGDKIIVKPDTYIEDIIINKSLTIVSESGNSSDTIVESAKGSDDIFSVWSNGVSIKGFSINGARYAGIHLFGVTGCNITNNNLSNNGCGIDLYMFSSGNVLDNNQISDSVTGISLGDSWFNSLSNNSVSNCSNAISLFDSCNNTLKNNLLSKNSDGVSLIGESNSNNLTSNILNSNTKTGLHLYGTSNNLIYNNYFNNKANVEFEAYESVSGTNIWNKDKTAGTNIVGGPYLGGNFWAKPDGTGFSQINADSDGDGIGDLLYNVSGNEIDYLPLAGNNTVNLTKSDVNGTNSKFDRIIVKEPSGPVADFSSNINPDPFIVQFTDTSTGTPTSWKWDFGDGANSTDQNPSHTYSSAGTYTVNLTVSNENGNSSKAAQITIIPIPVYPVANFNSVQTRDTLSVQFTDASTGTPSLWNWDFGDGANSTDPNPSHTYSIAGTYTVNLTVNNENGNSTKTAQIIVIPISGIPVANFNSAQIPGSFIVQFTDTSTGTPSLWNWDFGDGANSTDPNPSHTYSIAGTYTVNLTVNNENGNFTKTAQINVIPISVIPVANFNSAQIPGSLIVQFTDTSTGTPISWKWDFGDGATSIEQNPVHIYTAAGNYNVNLTVNYENGTALKVWKITVHEASIENKIFPIANFSAYPTSGNAPLSVQFTDFSQNAVSRTWDFNNDGVADPSGINPVYTYTVPGTYISNLTVSNANGTASKNVTITVLDAGISNIKDSSSHSSSSGGGGGGGSPEPQNNVEVKELSQTFITSGNSVRFDFPRNATSVVYISFNSKKTAGKTTTIVEMLKGKSILVSGLPSGEVYKSLNIWVGNSGFATPNNIENAVICFKIEKSWMQDKNISRSSINLNRYSDKKWDQLPTNVQSEDNNYLYFTAQTPGFSPFAIMGNAVSKDTVANIQPAADTKIQPGAKSENVVQNSTVSGTGQESEQKSDQKSEQKSGQGKSSNLPVFGMICMIALLLVAFLFKIDKT